MRDQPAGWYRDTDRPNVHRYWTGNRWSERTGEELALAERARVPEQRHEEPCSDRCSDRAYDERACG
jgi:hypothetical protein